ncbi:MAG: 30S ribosomal protein S19e [Nitrososphaerota archaeon]|jgi:small subunit ribosomal protein S19e|nr:30S ribosomal protein S19e [Nitrososphaerota archaeon]MDG6947960.1 30S ribosomal protein S19e [Nitrososphaerota archaeon]
MVSAHDVPSGKLISALAEQMKSLPSVQEPEWAKFVKTGSHAERPPTNPDWWFSRAASLLRKVYLHGPIGLSDLERAYGGSKALHYFPKHHRDAGGSSIRVILRQLEQAELVSKTPKGRVLTSKGRAMLDKIGNELFTALSKENKALERYA